MRAAASRTVRPFFDRHFRPCRFFSGDDSLAAALSSTRSSGARASAGSFADRIALDPGKSAEQVEDEGTAARSRVDAFGQGPESDAALIKFAHRVDQMAHAASETVELPYDQRVAGTQVIKLRDALGILPLKSAA